MINKVFDNRIWPSVCVKCRIKIVCFGFHRNLCEDCREEIDKEFQKETRKTIKQYCAEQILKDCQNINLNKLIKEQR